MLLAIAKAMVDRDTTQEDRVMVEGRLGAGGSQADMPCMSVGCIRRVCAVQVGSRPVEQ